ncbi:hypothetical protein FC99_GL000222 [Levilactobacillus koreensis JCM 16448]|nr:hypothetical protein FC99_GL000222 [Levilactobacillus koreensis JCM 16448]
MTSIVRIQAHKREGVIRTAALQDKSGGDVKNITSHQPEDLQAAMTLKVPAGDTVIALENQEHAQFVREEITDLKPDKDITAEIDQEGRLLLNNDQDQAQKVEVVVPVKVADPLLMDELQLELQVVDKNETYGLATLAVKADSDKGAATTTENDNNSNHDNDKPATDNNNSNNNSSSKVTSSSKSAAKKKPSRKSQSAKQRSRSTKSKTPTTSSSKSASKEAADDDADADAAPATKISRMSQAVDPADRLTGSAIDIYRGQVQIGSWSDEMTIGGTLKEEPGVELHKKSAGVNGSGVGSYYKNENYKTHYYISYQQKDNAASYAIAFKKDTSLGGKTINVYYPDVGAYTTSSGSEKLDKKMGAIIEISNLVYSPKLTGGKDAYIDFSSNFYSGIIYNGIESFDLDITFTNEDGTRALKFPEAEEKTYRSYFTFGSLNGNVPGDNEWAGTKSGREGILSKPTTIEEHAGGWYKGVGEGVYMQYDNGEYLPHMGENQWGDFLGSPNYEKGAVSFPLVGKKHEFMLRSDAGFTWQSFSTGSIIPLAPEKPVKTVDRSKKFGIENNDLHGATINRDEDDIDSFNYTVYQKTYNIPDESIAKPNRITLTDTLPDGMSTTLESIRLYNTDGQVLTDFVPEELRETVAPEELGTIAPGDRGKVTIDGQKVTYELSDKEIEKLDFNGGYFAFQITIKIDDDFVGTFKNKANVRFYSDKDYDWNNDTNEVVTHLNRGLTLRKIGDNRWNPADTERLKDVVFNIVGGDDQRRIETNEDGEIVLEKMNSKEVYTFTEEVPEGYVSPQKFTLAYNENDNRWEITSGSAQIEITNDKNSQVITVKNQVERGDYQFKKIDGTDDTQLAGAEFIIRSKSGKYLKFDDDGKMSGTVDTPEEATRLKSFAKETTKVTGLPYGKYKLIEAKAPDGYVVGATHKFTVSKDSGTKVMDIKNDPYSLPITGGRGIIWFIGLGLILTLSALALWRTHPRGG